MLSLHATSPKKAILSKKQRQDKNTTITSFKNIDKESIVVQI